MKGNNPIRKPETGDGQSLAVQHIFPTLQGEGPFAGWPAVFVRLGGCNLACHFCDTEFESFKQMSLGEIIDQVKEYSSVGETKLIVITGGEPLRQNIAPLCERLIEEGFKVQIETNGTLRRDLPKGVDIVCSPKNTGQGYVPPHDDLLAGIGALKFIVSATDARYDHVPPFAAAPHGIPVYVQPMDEYDDEKNAANRALALKLAQAHGYRLSLQLHKLLGIE